MTVDISPRRPPFARHAGAMLATTSLCAGLCAGFVLGQSERSARAAPGAGEPAAPAGYSRLRKLDVFARALALIEQRYVRPVDGERLVASAISGLVAELDPHSEYLPAAEAKLLTEDIGGRFGGVGLVVVLESDENDEPVLGIQDVIPGAPAAIAGIEVGDHVISIEGKPIAHFHDLGEAIKIMRGHPGTIVRFTVRRPGSDPRPIEITREIVDAPAVEVSYLGDGFGVLRLRDFQEASARDVREGLRELERDSPDGLRGVVLDLRNNGGGLLDQAIRIVDLFVARGPIVRTRGRKGRLLDEAHATAAGTRAKVPLVVLINKASASASEIVAGALQDHHRALIIGERSYGKGSVQTPFRLGDGSILKLTIALYYTPDDRLIQASGIRPDVRVGTVSAEYSDGLPSLEPEREVPRHLRPEDFGGTPTEVTPDDEGSSEALPTAVREAGDDAQLVVAVRHLLAWDRVGPGKRGARGRR